MSGSEREILPEPGRIPRDNDISAEEWKNRMEKRREALIGATMDVLSNNDDAREVARKLNRLFAPFNVYDVDGRRSNHLVVTAEGENELLFEFYDRHGEDPMDFRTVERISDGYWWFADRELTEEPTAELHSTVAYSCLSLAPWANEEMIARATSGFAGEE